MSPSKDPDTGRGTAVAEKRPPKECPAAPRRSPHRLRVAMARESVNAAYDVARHGEWVEGQLVSGPTRADEDFARRLVDRVIDRVVKPFRSGKRAIGLPWQKVVDDLIEEHKDVPELDDILGMVKDAADELHGVIAHFIEDGDDRLSCDGVVGNRECSAGAHVHWRHPTNKPDRLRTVNLDRVKRYIRSRLPK